ncbi:sigma-54 interaction domain-containing protein [Engelhardtia mirabilis]|uniref:Transcriptional regulatory protein ZraR n=1 Tax=Engelhardtia mirabilis TaxID=2528011 RepID=A0A518BIV2_9BACT|nr:Transcriptional regulatory protein ZraR [Planctomycetes bacterium Pla133]QDV01223.1 Transcriptional regulatory protein ZraR [Planctomycetes bacterium Pla86]
MSRGEGDVGDLERRARALAADAVAAGRGDELRAWIDESLAEGASGPSEPVKVKQPIPGRFGMVGDSPPMHAVFDLIERVAPSDVPVLVHGETGTGKELVAKAIHDNSKRAKKPFVAVNCAAVPPNLLESELFGHVRGSFTGAVADRPGHFVSADGGTLFLDEIGDMPLDMQAKLLRTLQEGEVRAVGASRTRKVDVRIVAASHRDLAAMCAEGTFREDLYFRLHVIRIELPPLRDRGGDVALIVRALFAGLAREMGKPEPVLSPEAMDALSAWSWPGNVRELENELRRAIALSGDRVGLEDLTPALARG